MGTEDLKRRAAPGRPLIKLKGQVSLGLEQGGKVALFIDGPNLHYTTKALGFDVDFRSLLTEFAVGGLLTRAHYYTVVAADREEQLIKPLTDWLDYNGFTVRLKKQKPIDDGEGRRKVSRSVSLDISIDAMEISRYVDHIILISGDADLRYLVEAIQRRGVRVPVISSIQTNPAIASKELRRAADNFVELSTLRERIGRSIHPVTQ